jgi:hypothetical protein
MKTKQEWVVLVFGSIVMKMHILLTRFIRNNWINNPKAAVLKLGVATLLRVAKDFSRVAKFYLGFCYQPRFYTYGNKF